MNLADTHCHLDFDRFDADRSAVLARAAAAGVGRILIPGIDLPSSRRALQLASSNPKLFAAVGVHPTDCTGFNQDDLAALRALAAHPRVKAIGEIGLDYHWERAAHAAQQAALRAQLDLAAEMELPVVIHLREKGDVEGGRCAHDLLGILQEWTASLATAGSPLAARPGVLHSFSSSLDVARQAVAWGFLIGITGPVTYKNAETKRAVVRALPLTTLLIETDAPFLAPHPERGKRNEPAFVAHIAGKIAEIHNITPAEAAAITSANAARLFGWGHQE